MQDIYKPTSIKPNCRNACTCNTVNYIILELLYMVQVPVSDEGCELELSYKDIQICVGDFVFIKPRYSNSKHLEILLLYLYLTWLASLCVLMAPTLVQRTPLWLHIIYLLPALDSRNFVCSFKTIVCLPGLKYRMETYCFSLTACLFPILWKRAKSSYLAKMFWC